MHPHPLDPELSALQSELLHWRQHRVGRQIPSEIATRAVALLEHYRPTVIMHALKIDSRTLRRWRQLYGGVSPLTEHSLQGVVAVDDFVTLPIAPSVEQTAETTVCESDQDAFTLTLTRQAADHATLSMAATLTLNQWRQVRQLLEVSE